MKTNKRAKVMEQKTIDRHFGNFHIAGFTFWEGCMVFHELKIGTQLKLIREADNKFDPYAVAIYHKDYKLGFIPEGQNQTISQLLDLGYTDIFDVRIQRLSPEAHPEKQVGIVIFIKEANNVFNKLSV